MHRVLARAGLLLALTGLVACAGKAPAPPPKSPPPSRPPPAATALASAADVRTRVTPDADLVVYLDAAGFRASTPFRALESALAVVPGVAAERSKLTHRCGFDPIEALEAVAVSAERVGGAFDENSVIVAARFAEPPWRVLDCVARLAPNTSKTLLDRRQALSLPDGAVLVGDGELLLAGPRARVEDALSRRPVAVRPLESGTYLEVRTNALEGHGLGLGTFSMLQQRGGTRLRLVSEATSPEAATRAEARFRELRDLGRERVSQVAPSEAVRGYMTSLLDELAIETKGRATSATLDLPTAQAEAAFTGMFSALAIYGVRRYIARAKTAEAHTTVAQIAKALSAHGIETGRFPKTAPRTPKDVPAGTKFTPDDKTWSHASWKAIGFRHEGPQYYAYEYETSPDGRRATVRAHGDLDGDGVTSRFELPLQITAAGEVVIAPELTELEPLE